MSERTGAALEHVGRFSFDPRVLPGNVENFSELHDRRRGRAEHDRPGDPKLAEICAATVLAGDTSLTAAILAGHWVSSHERLGRNR